MLFDQFYIFDVTLGSPKILIFNEFYAHYANYALYFCCTATVFNLRSGSIFVSHFSNKIIEVGN